MNGKHFAIVSLLTGAAVAADQLAGTGILTSLGPWGAVAQAVLSGAAYAYLHRVNSVS